MNGRMAKKIRRAAPLVLHKVLLKAEAEGGDLSKVPTVRQTYRMLKRRYTRST